MDRNLENAPQSPVATGEQAHDGVVLKPWRKPELTVLSVEQTRANASAGTDASDCINTAS